MRRFIWTPWNDSFEMCLSFLGPVACIFTFLSFLRGHHREWLLDGRYSFQPWVSSGLISSRWGAMIIDDCDILCLLMWQEIFHFSQVIQNSHCLPPWEPTQMVPEPQPCRQSLWTRCSLEEEGAGVTSGNNNLEVSSLVFLGAEEGYQEPRQAMPQATKWPTEDSLSTKLRGPAWHSCDTRSLLHTHARSQGQFPKLLVLIGIAWVLTLWAPSLEEESALEEERTKERKRKNRVAANHCTTPHPTGCSQPAGKGLGMWHEAKLSFDALYI